jgi:anti-sigma factor RsiW
MSATPITGTLRRLLGPGEPEVSCEVCFAQLDAYVDAEVLGQDADAAVPGMRAHLAGCPACADEHESLKALVTSE